MMIRQSLSSVLKGISVLVMCGTLSGCFVFYGAMCGTMAVFTPSESVTRIPVQDAVIGQAYDQTVEVAEFGGRFPFSVGPHPEWLTVTLMAKNDAGEWTPLITDEDWKKWVTDTNESRLIAARLQGTPSETGKIRVNVNGIAYRTMCGTSDPVYSLRLTVKKAE